MPERKSLDFYAPQPWPQDGESKDQPWLKWPDEPENDYARFQCYRDLPPPRRTLENAVIVYSGGAVLGSDEKAKVPVSWQSLRRKWHWIDRCSKFDRWKEKSQLEAERDGTLQAWREMGERHAREAMALQQKALERLQTLSPRELSAAEVRQFLVQAATLERLARGASLQDMARAQREKEEEAAREGVAVITYVDDWRGDSTRLSPGAPGGMAPGGMAPGGRNPNSFYGNGQGALPTPLEKKEPKKRGRPAKPKPEGVALVRPDGAPAFGSRSDAPLPIPDPPPGADRGGQA
jgi:hypothetical protein